MQIFINDGEKWKMCRIDIIIVIVEMPKALKAVTTYFDLYKYFTIE